MTAAGSLDGKTVLVTGVSRRAGIGWAIASRVAAEGAAVYLTGWPAHDTERGYRAEPGAHQLAADLRAAGGRAEAADADLADPGTPRRLVAAAAAWAGRLDAVVANHARSGIEDLESLTAAEIDLTLAVNVRATLLLVKELAGARPPGREPGGRVVLFTSGQYHGAMPAELPYVASKGALHQLTASLAAHLMPRGITVNCVDPGPNDTGYADDALRAAVASRNPGGRWGTPDDTARLVAWLLGDDAGWITGQVIASDGGWGSAP